MRLAVALLFFFVCSVSFVFALASGTNAVQLGPGRFALVHCVQQPEPMITTTVTSAQGQGSLIGNIWQFPAILPSNFNPSAPSHPNTPATSLWCFRFLGTPGSFTNPKGFKVQTAQTPSCGDYTCQGQSYTGGAPTTGEEKYGSTNGVVGSNYACKEDCGCSIGTAYGPKDNVPGNNFCAATCLPNPSPFNSNYLTQGCSPNPVGEFSYSLNNACQLKSVKDYCLVCNPGSGLYINSLNPSTGCTEWFSGDGICRSDAPYNEPIGSADCPILCNNDFVCDPGENNVNCPSDCLICNNDGSCNIGGGETYLNCINDCPDCVSDYNGCESNCLSLDTSCQASGGCCVPACTAYNMPPCVGSPSCLDDKNTCCATYGTAGGC